MKISYQSPLGSFITKSLFPSPLDIVTMHFGISQWRKILGRRSLLLFLQKKTILKGSNLLFICRHQHAWLQVQLIVYLCSLQTVFQKTENFGWNWAWIMEACWSLDQNYDTIKMISLNTTLYQNINHNLISFLKKGYWN